MKTVKRIIAFFLTLVMLLMLAACGGASEKPASQEQKSENKESTASPEQARETGISVTDMSGRTVILEKSAEKVVALTAADCEILFALGAGDLLVGRGEYCDWPEEVLSAPAVQSGYETNIEQIIALAPDAVIMSMMEQTEEQVDMLEKAGIKVVQSYAQNIEEIYTAIELIGAVTGRDDEAAALIGGMKDEFTACGKSAAENEGKTVYFEVSPLEYGLWTSGSGTFMDELAGMLGMTNIFADFEGWAEVSEEQVIEMNPDYIVTISMYFGEGPTPVEEIMGREGWQNITAVKNGAILNADSNEISRPGPRLVDAVKTLDSFFAD